MSILVTRPSPAGEELVSRLRTLGQVAWHFPLIEFSPGRQLPQLADQLAALGRAICCLPSRNTRLLLPNHSCISKIVNGPDYLIISPLTHHRTGATYRKRTEDSLPAGSGNQRSLATIT